MTNDDAIAIDTPRLSLRPCDGVAARELTDAVLDARVYASYFIGIPQRFPDLAPDHWQQRDKDGNGSPRLTLAARLREGGAIIGMVQFDRGQLGFFVGADRWGQGYGGEMVGAACAQVAPMLGLSTLEAQVLRGNAASSRLLEHIGFRFCGLRLRARTGAGGAVTMLHYVLDRV